MSKVTDDMIAVSGHHVGFGGVRNGLDALFNAGLIALPADTAEVREAAIRECIAALRETFVWRNGIDYQNAFSALTLLLPTKDEAEKLHEQFLDEHPTCPGEWGWRDHSLAFARWLLSRGEG